MCDATVRRGQLDGASANDTTYDDGDRRTATATTTVTTTTTTATTTIVEPPSATSDVDVVATNVRHSMTEKNNVVHANPGVNEMATMAEVDDDDDDNDDKDDEESDEDHEENDEDDARHQTVVTTTMVVVDDKFDPYDYGNAKNPTSFWGTVMHMLIVAMSPTLVNLPSTFDQVGYAVGVCGAFTTVMVYAYCMHMIVDGEYTLCKRTRLAKMSYPQVVWHAFAGGPPRLRWLAGYAKLAIYAALISIWAGGNAIYVLQISEYVRSTLCWLGQPAGRCVGGDLDDRTVIAYLVVPLVSLCWLPDLRTLVAFSAFANAVNVCSIVVIVATAAAQMPPLAERRPVGDVTKIPYFLGVIFVTINGTGLLMSLKNQMRSPRKFRSRMGVLNVSYAVTGFIYAFFGFVCYARYGAKTRPNVLQNLPAGHFSNAVRALVALAVICFYPLVSYVTFDLVWNDLLRTKGGKRGAGVGARRAAYRRPLKYAVRTASALSSIVLAYALPNVSTFVSFTGTVCAALDSIIMPAVIDLLVNCGGGGDDEPTRRPYNVWRSMKNGLIIVLGMVCAVAGLADSLRDIRDKYIV